jgi:cytosolic 5'-nucleotidase 3
VVESDSFENCYGRKVIEGSNPSVSAMKNIFIQKEFEELKKRFKEDGVGKLHVLADFDRTLTKAFANGKKIPSLMSVLRDENYLTPDYPAKANALYEKYHAIEINLNIPQQEKKEKMEEWWRLHFKLLIESGLKKEDLEKAMKSANLALRDGCVELLDFLKEKDIPLVILSSAGLGIESIELFLKNRGLLYPNIYIISNYFEWDKNGKAVSVKEPIIHGMNKSEITIKNFPNIFNEIKDKTNIILLGDSLSDIEMAEGFEYKNLLKIGFLNEDFDQNLVHYQKAFDVVLTHDSSVQFVLDLLKELF